MLQQTAQPRMMKLPRRRRLPICLRNLRVSKHSMQQPLQIGIGHAFHAGLQVRPQHRDVKSSRRQQIALVHLAGLRLAKLIDLHLHPVVKARRAPAHLHRIAAIEHFLNARVPRLPDAPFNLAALVAQYQAQIRLVGFRRPLLLRQHQEKSVEGSALIKGGKVGNINVFHSAQKHTTCPIDAGEKVAINYP